MNQDLHKIIIVGGGAGGPGGEAAGDGVDGEAGLEGDVLLARQRDLVGERAVIARGADAGGRGV